MASPGKVQVFKDTFQAYRTQQLKLTKRGVLPPMRPGKAVVDVSEGGAAADPGGTASADKPKPKGKVEIMPKGRKKA